MTNQNNLHIYKMSNEGSKDYQDQLVIDIDTQVLLQSFKSTIK